MSTDWPAIVTAAGTAVLAVFTTALAIYTRLLVRVTQQPFVVATIEPNPQALMYVDLHVGNEGNASAFDVAVSFDPPLPTDKNSSESGPLPFSHVTVLRPGQKLVSFICGFAAVEDKVYKATITWRKTPTARAIERISYNVTLNHFKGFSRLGNDYGEKSAKSLEKMASALSAVADGHKTLRVDTFNPVERARERRNEARQRRRWMRERQAATAAAPVAGIGGETGAEES